MGTSESHAADDALDGGIGVIGGMGPAATERFFEKILFAADGDSDQSNPRVVIDNNTNIPDRTDYIVGDGPSPEPFLRSTAKELESTGVEVLATPCNTAHYFIGELRAAVEIPIIDMLEVATEEATSAATANRVGLLATTGTIQSGLYQDRLSGKDAELVLPSEPTQEELVMPAIYGENGVKAGSRDRPREKLLRAIEKFDSVDTVIAGCTEIELVLSDEMVDVRLINPMDVLSNVAVSTVKNSAGP